MTEEKQKAILKKTESLWNDRKRLEQLEKENEELKKDKEYLDKVNNEQTEVILKLNEQIEKMKCCENCKHNQNKLEDNEVCWNCERSCAKFGEEIIKDEWELAE